MTEAGQRTLDIAERALTSRDLARALALFDTAEGCGADRDRCAAGRWLAHMLLGDFGSAWHQSDAIAFRNPQAPDRFWQGEDLRGKRVILRCLHGYGDAIQLLRFAPLLSEVAASLVVEVAPPLLSLAPWIDGVDEVITWGNQAPAIPPRWDVQVEVNELMYMLRITLDDVRRLHPYLHIPSIWLQQFRPKPTAEASVKIGLVWAAGSWNQDRSIPFSALAPLMSVPGCEFWNLQGGEARSDWPTSGDACLHAAEDCASSTSALAALIAQLDLIITCDTLAAHLAGAQGTPCWLLLQYAADWRWMHDREDTPWYPSMRLFRRASHEDWHQLTEHVAEELRTHVLQRVHS